MDEEECAEGEKRRKKNFFTLRLQPTAYWLHREVCRSRRSTRPRKRGTERQNAWFTRERKRAGAVSENTFIELSVSREMNMSTVERVERLSMILVWKKRIEKKQNMLNWISSPNTKANSALGDGGLRMYCEGMPSRMLGCVTARECEVRSARSLRVCRRLLGYIVRSYICTTQSLALL